LQFVPIRLNALKPKETDFEPKTLGQHLRKRRLILGLTQKQVGKALRLSPFTVLNLEKGHTQPSLTVCPALIGWLGYDPFPALKTLQDRMRAVRRARGWTIVEAARHIGIDPATWGRWERTGLPLWPRYRTRLEEFLTRAGYRPDSPSHDPDGALEYDRRASPAGRYGGSPKSVKC
jgi:DNA-binding XRE family transcriptional regulator